jgi:cardiolipin synthase
VVACGLDALACVLAGAAATTLHAFSRPQGPYAAAFLVRNNIRHRRDIEDAYLQAIEQAQSEIILANAYFLPGLNFRHALVDAAGRGVRVVLLLQGRMDHRLLHYASHALYGSFLDAGIEIYEYHKCLMHAKVAVIDEHWATVGSSNLDPFSLLLRLKQMWLLTMKLCQ